MLEIITHCWKYPRLLSMQLSSLIGSLGGLPVRVVCYFAVIDTPTCRVVEHFDRFHHPLLYWDWRPVTHAELSNRAIGRQRAAVGNRADVLWFADCDHLVSPALLQAVPRQRPGSVWYPRVVLASAAADGERAIASWNPTPERAGATPVLAYEPVETTGPGGGMLFVDGLVARRAGYLPGLSRSLRPYLGGNWRLDDDGRAVAAALGKAQPADLPGLRRIRHVQRGGPASVVQF